MSLQQSATSPGEQNADIRPDNCKDSSPRGVETSSTAPAGRRAPTHARNSNDRSMPPRQEPPMARVTDRSATGKSNVPPVQRLFLDLPTVAEAVALSQSTVQELVRLGQFPQPRQMSGRRVGWLVREIEEWAETRPTSTLPPPPNTGAKKPRPALRTQRAASSTMGFEATSAAAIKAPSDGADVASGSRRGAPTCPSMTAPVADKPPPRQQRYSAEAGSGRR